MFDFQNNWVLFLALVVAVATVVQVIYYLVVFSKLAFYKGLSEPNSSELKPLSVLIAARNEYKNLE